MRLFEFVDSPDLSEPLTHSTTESTVIIKSEEAPRALERPAHTGHALFEMYDGEVRVTDRTPIQQQRYLDGTPHTTPGHSSLRPPDPTLYLDGLSKGVNEDGVKDDRSNPFPKTDPDAVVKAFLDFEG